MDICLVLLFYLLRVDVRAKGSQVMQFRLNYYGARLLVVGVAGLWCYCRPQLLWDEVM